MGKVFKVVVCGLRRAKMIVDLCNTEEQMRSTTVRQLKENIHQRLPEYAGERLKLIFTDKLLDYNNKLLSNYGIQRMSLIHMITSVPGGGPLVPREEDGGMGDKTGKNRNTRQNLQTNTTDMIIQVIVLRPDGTYFNPRIYFSNRVTVLEAKKTVKRLHKIPEDEQRLISFDRMLEDDSKLLSNYESEHKSWISSSLDAPQKPQTSTADKAVKVVVLQPDSKRYSIVDLCDTEEQLKSITVLQLKEKMRLLEGVPGGDEQLLISRDRMLTDDKLLSDCGIKDMSSVSLLDTRKMLQMNTTNMSVKVILFLSFESYCTINLCDTEEQLKSITVLQLKEKIGLLFGASVREQELTSCHEVLQTHRLLSDYGIEHMSAIHLEIHRFSGCSGFTNRDEGMGDKQGKNRSMEILLLL